MEQTTNSVKFKDIILYINRENEKVQHNFLKMVTRFLKTQKSLANRFSYAGEDHDLSRVLSLKENLLFETLSAKGESEKNFNLLEFVANFSNPHLLKLFRKLPEEDCKIDELSSEEAKLASLIKAFLKNSPVYLFERPEKNLSRKNLELLQLAMEHHGRVHNKIFFIDSEAPDLWHGMANKIFYRGDKSEYKIAPIPALQLLESFDFAIPEEIHTNDEEDHHLLFKNLPENLIAK